MKQTDILCPECFHGRIIIKDNEKDGICPKCEEEFILVDYKRNRLQYAHKF